MIWIGSTPRVRISKMGKTTEKSATAFGSTSSKKQDGSGYEYSNWTVVFVSNARQMMDLISEGVIIEVKKGFITNVKYEKADGETVWNNPKIVVTDFEVYRAGSGSSTPVAGNGVEIPDEDDIPF